MSESDFRELVAEMLQSWDRYRQTRSPDMLEEAEEKERTVRGRPSDEELCQQFQAGDRAAVNDLITRYRPLVCRISQEARGRQRLDLESIVQIGNLALHDAARRWDPARGAKFGTIAYVYIGRAVRRYVRDEAAKVQKARIERSNMDETLGLQPGRAATPDPDPDIPISHLLDHLDHQQKTIIELSFGLHGNPRGPVQIANILGLRRKEVKRILSESLAILKLAAQPGTLE